MRQPVATGSRSARCSRSPNGRPVWLALRDIDLNAKWPEVEKRWQTRETPADWLAYPDTQLDLAEFGAIGAGFHSCGRIRPRCA